MKDIWIIANWKSHKDISQSLEWIDIVGPRIAPADHLKVVVCPSFTALSDLKKTIEVSKYQVTLGAQNISPFDSGPFTGEESGELLSQLSEIVIIGHSERRKNFNETEQIISLKIQEAKKFNLNPLLCVSSQDQLVSDQVQLVAYEPLFAVGTGIADTPENAADFAKKLKQKNPNLIVFYGGSVDHNNAKAFLDKPDLSGLLIGKSSLDAEEFIKIIDQAKEIL